jgi:maltooligosyltrehalose trehalohydrolase
MQTFRVWATFPKRVELALGEQRLPMQRGEDDWWSVTVDPALPPTADPDRAVVPQTSDSAVSQVGKLAPTPAASDCDYGFLLDGEGPYPDPRSPWQPNGVHALSRLVDHAAFRWTDTGFNAPPLSEAVLYELHIGTFTPAGTFESAIGKLDHLVALGVTHVQIMPVVQFSGEHGWGYDGVDLFAPHSAYGGPAGLKRLVDACHARGLAVLLDVVYNHLGPTGNYLGKYAPYFSDHYHTPWGPAVNFDGPHSGEVRRFFCDNALMWLRDYHFDGLRLDAVHAIFDMSARPFLEQLGDEVQQLGQQTKRRLVVIAESDLNDPRLIRPRERGGFALDAQWSDDFHHALHTVLTHERNGYYEDFGTLADLAKALRQAYVYDGRYSVHRNRLHGRPPSELDGHHFLSYAQTHDQVGNRARGERLCHLVSPGLQKIAAALVFTSPFVPMLFQGEEWAASSPFQFFTDHPEPDLAKAVREGRRKEFGAFGWKPDEVPDPQDPGTFERSKLNWQESSAGHHAEMLAWHRQLIQLRRTEPALSDGRLGLSSTRFDEVARWLVLERGPITVACNLAAQAKRLPLRDGKYAILLASDEAIRIAGDAVNLVPDSVVIVKRLA